MSKEIFPSTASTPLCTLTAAERPVVQRDWHQLLDELLESREEVPGGIRLRFQPTAASELRRLVDTERRCCRWITFELDGPELTMTADGDGESVLRAGWRPTSESGRPTASSAH